MQFSPDTLAWWQPLYGFLHCPLILNIVEHPRSLLRDAVDVIAALSTVAVGFFAGVQLWKEHVAAKDRTARTDARIGSIAFALRRQVDSWLARPEMANLNSAGPWTDYMVGPTNAAEIRLTELMTLAPAASPRVQKVVKIGFVAFYEAFDVINAIRELAHQNRPQDAAKRMSDAKARLEYFRGWISAASTEDLRATDGELAHALASQSTAKGDELTP